MSGKGGMGWWACRGLVSQARGLQESRWVPSGNTKGRRVTYRAPGAIQPSPGMQQDYGLSTEETCRGHVRTCVRTDDDRTYVRMCLYTVRTYLRTVVSGIIPETAPPDTDDSFAPLPPPRDPFTIGFGPPAP